MRLKLIGVCRLNGETHKNYALVCFAVFCYCFSLSKAYFLLISWYLCIDHIRMNHWIPCYFTAPTTWVKKEYWFRIDHLIFMINFLCMLVAFRFWKFVDSKHSINLMLLFVLLPHLTCPILLPPFKTPLFFIIHYDEERMRGKVYFLDLKFYRWYLFDWISKYLYIYCFEIINAANAISTSFTL